MIAPRPLRPPGWGATGRRLCTAALLLGAAVAVGAGALPAAASPAAPTPPAASPLLADRILVEKHLHRLTLFHAGQILRTYRVALGSGGLDRKLRQGDAKVPEGLYRIDGRNVQSAYHRALHLSYPNPTDLARARAAGVLPGGDIMIHGIKNGYAYLGSLHLLHDWTLGCIAVTNPEIEEIWALVPTGCPIEIRP